MGRPAIVGAALCGVILLFTGNAAVHAEDLPLEYQSSVSRGLKWLQQHQQPDGHWESSGGEEDLRARQRWTIASTSLGGIALLMQGSTAREGMYSDSIRRVRDWLLKRQRLNGLIAVASSEQPNEGHSYMHGHGFATLFLACLVGEEESVEQRARLVEVLEKACRFSGFAQSRRHGGWSYVSFEDKGDASMYGDEGSVTVTQMQALRAARNAGVAVPKEIIDRGIQYLKLATNKTYGGVCYSVIGERGSPSKSLTAAAVVCGYSAGDYESDCVKRWIQFCQRDVQNNLDQSMSEYAHLYLAQLMYILGEDRYARLFPESPSARRLTWSKYRKARFGDLMRSQAPDGSWAQSNIGRAYNTAVNLITMQLDHATLPIFQR